MPSFSMTIKYRRAAKLESDRGKRRKEKQTQEQLKEGHREDPPCHQRARDLFKDGDKKGVTPREDF